MKSDFWYLSEFSCVARTRLASMISVLFSLTLRIVCFYAGIGFEKVLFVKNRILGVHEDRK